MRMKRLITAALCLLLLLSLFTSPISAAGTGYIRGDADGDGSVTVIDATVIQKLLASLKDDPDGGITRRGSVTSEKLTITDATAIQRYLAHFPDRFGIGELVEDMTEAPTQAPTQAPTSAPTRDPDELPFVPAR